MRYRLRTLLILLAVGPPMLAWWGWPMAKSQYDAWRWRKAVELAKHIRPTGGGLRLVPKDRYPVLEGGGLVEVPVDE